MKVKTLRLSKRVMVSVEKEGKSFRAKVWQKYKDAFLPVLEVQGKDGLDHLDLRVKVAIMRLAKELGL